jgi:hypothetical protein
MSDLSKRNSFLFLSLSIAVHRWPNSFSFQREMNAAIDEKYEKSQTEKDEKHF